ncbi:MAG: S41 family peptidase [Candidatus Nealsonbacteria bacterium]|nr:MAG: S41 family peptidase [Candidatus Nealsonbacteria bacterium]
MGFKKTLISIFLVIVILASFGGGFYFGKSQCKICPPEEIDFSLFWEAWDKLQEKFANKEKFDIQEMIYGAISGMVKSLEDPYTTFLNPEDTKRFIEDVKGTFEGVGMEIGLKKGQLQVIAPLEGTPAQKAGVLAGDKIIKVDDTLTLDITLDEAVNLIRGPKGTEVTLTIYREEWGTTKEIKIVRGVIEIPSLKWEIIDENIAYLKLYHFSEKASFDFREAAIEILASPCQKIILDLRNNPGGYLEVAQDIAGWFLERGQIVVIEDFGRETEQKIYKAKGNASLVEYPIVILINQGSASGSEILAGALRDNRGIKLIGEKSFGKGSVQELERLREGSSLKITVAKWLTPKGELITDKGLEPDIKIEMTEEDYEEDRDPQLNKAIEIIKNL